MVRALEREITTENDIQTRRRPQGSSAQSSLAEKKSSQTRRSVEDKRRFLLNLTCFASCIEGLFFFGAFAYVYFLRSRGLLPGLASGTNWAFRDESAHMAFAYQVLDSGIPVYAADGVQVGTVDHVVAAPGLDIFHGIVLRVATTQRFVAADQVAGVANGVVDKVDEPCTVMANDVGAAATSTDFAATAEGPPLLLTVSPVKVWVFEVPAESVSVTVALNVPALA